VALVRLESRDSGVRVVTLDDPARRNAMGDELGADLLDACAEVAGDPHARVLVLTGAGGPSARARTCPSCFGPAADAPVAETHARLQRYYRPFFAVRDLAIPTVAAVNGPAVGAGLNLAHGPATCAWRGRRHCSRRLHAHRPAPRRGCTWFLVQALGASGAAGLLLGEAIRADRAVAWGLAEGPEEDPLAAALELADRVAEVDPSLTRHVKAAVEVAVRTGDLRATLEYESWAQAASASSPLLQEWVARFRT
jgi:enoyl-CoA hydratase